MRWGLIDSHQTIPYEVVPHGKWGYSIQHTHRFTHRIPKPNRGNFKHLNTERGQNTQQSLTNIDQGQPPPWEINRNVQRLLNEQLPQNNQIHSTLIKSTAIERSVMKFENPLVWLMTRLEFNVNINWTTWIINRQNNIKSYTGNCTELHWSIRKESFTMSLQPPITH